MKNIVIERLKADVFWDGYKEESKEEFSNFLHCGFSVLYSEEEKEKFKSFKPSFKDEAQIFLFARLDGKIVGRSFSEQTTKDTLFMCMSYVKEEYRKCGVYTQLLKNTIQLAKDIGYMKITSCHNTSNNKIIIPKLKEGFVMSGMRVNAGYGTLVELTLLLNEREKDMQDFRCGYRKPTNEVKQILSI